MAHVELTILSFTCVALLILVLPLHLRRHNVANLAIIAWLVVCNVIHGVNALIWASNTISHVPVWCDIVTKVLLGSNIALPAACVYLCFHLELVASSRHQLGKSSRTKNFVLGALLFVFLPLLYVGLHTLVQPHRFEIVEDLGCQAAIFPSTLAIVLIWIPPLILCTVILVIIGLILYRVRNRNASFSEHLVNRSPLSPSRFIRFTFLYVIVALLTASLSVMSIASSVQRGLEPWQSFDQVHSHFFDIVVATASYPDDVVISWGWWMIPALSIVFAALSAFARESVLDYRAFGGWVRHQLLHRRSSSAKSTITSLLPLSSQVKLPLDPMGTNTNQEARPVDLRSGWDDTLDFKRSREKSRAKAVPSPTLLHPSDAASFMTTASSSECGRPGASSSRLSWTQPAPGLEFPPTLPPTKVGRMQKPSWDSLGADQNVYPLAQMKTKGMAFQRAHTLETN